MNQSNAISLDKQILNAVEAGDAKTLETLLAHIQENTDTSSALFWAAKKGHSDCVKLLISVGDPNAYQAQALRAAASEGHASCVEALIPVSDIGKHNPLCFAVQHNHRQCIELLLPHSSVEMISKAFWIGAVKANLVLMDKLFSHSDLDQYWNENSWNFLNSDVQAYLKLLIETQKQKKHLQTQLPLDPKEKQKIKHRI